jgi:hypothetical protein
MYGVTSGYPQDGLFGPSPQKFLKKFFVDFIRFFSVKISALTSGN